MRYMVLQCLRENVGNGFPEEWQPIEFFKKREDAIRNANHRREHYPNYEYLVVEVIDGLK